MKFSVGLVLISACIVLATAVPGPRRAPAARPPPPPPPPPPRRAPPPLPRGPPPTPSFFDSFFGPTPAPYGPTPVPRYPSDCDCKKDRETCRPGTYYGGECQDGIYCCESLY